MLVFFFILCNKSVCFTQKSQPHGKINFLEIWLFLPLYCRIFKTVCGWFEACKFGIHAIMCLNLHVKVGDVVIKTRLCPAGATHSNVGNTSGVRLD